MINTKEFLGKAKGAVSVIASRKTLPSVFLVALILWWNFVESGILIGLLILSFFVLVFFQLVKTLTEVLPTWKRK